MKITFINANGGGFADVMEVDDGSTVGEVFNQAGVMGSRSEYIFTVDSVRVTDMDTVVQEGQRVVISKRKIAGAGGKVVSINLGDTIIRIECSDGVHVSVEDVADTRPVPEDVNVPRIGVRVNLNNEETFIYETKATTLGGLFDELYEDEYLRTDEADNYEIHLNNQAEPSFAKLQDGDHVSICYIGGYDE